jgi:uncharacterized protein with PIN domain
MKFLCDRMLGTLAKWLRILGFDTYYANNLINDLEVINIAKKEKRILLTRDKNLIYQARRENIFVIEISATELDEQLKVALEDVEINQDLILTRCLICNSVLDDIKIDDVKDKIPDRVFKSNKKFWCCKNCDKIYWKGSHYDKMMAKILTHKK